MAEKRLAPADLWRIVRSLSSQEANEVAKRVAETRPEWVPVTLQAMETYSEEALQKAYQQRFSDKAPRLLRMYKPPLWDIAEVVLAQSPLVRHEVRVWQRFWASMALWQRAEMLIADRSAKKRYSALQQKFSEAEGYVESRLIKGCILPSLPESEGGLFTLKGMWRCYEPLGKPPLRTAESATSEFRVPLPPHPLRVQVTWEGPAGQRAQSPVVTLARDSYPRWENGQLEVSEGAFWVWSADGRLHQRITGPAVVSLPGGLWLLQKELAKCTESGCRSSGRGRKRPESAIQQAYRSQAYDKEGLEGVRGEHSQQGGLFFPAKGQQKPQADDMESTDAAWHRERHSYPRTHKQHPGAPSQKNAFLGGEGFHDPVDSCPIPCPYQQREGHREQVRPRPQDPQQTLHKLAHQLVSIAP